MIDDMQEKLLNVKEKVKGEVKRNGNITKNKPLYRIS